MKILAAAYGLQGVEHGAVIDAVLERQARNARFWAELVACPETAPADADVLAARIEWSRAEFAFTATPHVTPPPDHARTTQGPAP